MSTEYDRIYAFEATELTENDWELLLTRLRNGKTPYHQAVADVNPGPPSHWINQRARNGKMRRLLSRHEDNPRLYDVIIGKWTEFGRKYLATLDRLSGARLLRLRFGKWAAQQGMVYDGFDTNVHLVKTFRIPSQWRRIRVIDFGYTNPFVCQWWAIDPDGRMYLYREIYHSRRLVEDHAPKIVSLSADEEIEKTIADHDAEDRATLDRHGISTVPAWKAITPGIEAVQARLKIAGDGKPRLMILRDATVERDDFLAEAKRPLSTEQEIESYAYPKGVDGKPIKEEPLKIDDHGMDAMRYAVAYVDDIRNTGRAWTAGDWATVFGTEEQQAIDEVEARVMGGRFQDET
jgi:phage terminase large subunit